MTVLLSVIELVAFSFENVHFDEDVLVDWAGIHDLTRVITLDIIPRTCGRRFTSRNALPYERRN